MSIFFYCLHHPICLQQPTELILCFFTEAHTSHCLIERALANKSTDQLASVRVTNNGSESSHVFLCKTCHEECTREYAMNRSRSTVFSTTVPSFLPAVFTCDRLIECEGTKSDRESNLFKSSSANGFPLVVHLN